MDFVTALSTQFQLKPWQVQKVMELIDEGNTILLLPDTVKKRMAHWTTKRYAKLQTD